MNTDLTSRRTGSENIEANKSRLPLLKLRDNFTFEGEGEQVEGKIKFVFRANYVTPTHLPTPPPKNKMVRPFS